MIKATEYHKGILIEEEKRLSAYVRAGRESSADVVDPYQRMELDWRLQESEKRLREINNALLNMEIGIYGICEECGNAINPGRLEVLPWATWCVGCRASAERRLAKNSSYVHRCQDEAR